MSVARPNFAAIQVRLEQERIESRKRTRVREQIDTLLKVSVAPYATKDHSRGTWEVSTGAEEYPYIQVFSDIDDCKYLAFTWLDRNNVVNSAIMIKVPEDGSVLNHEGEMLKGTQLDEAISVLDFMLEKETTDSLNQHASHQ